MQACCVVDVLDDVGQVCGDILEGFVFCDVNGLDACLKALRKNDVLVVWKLDRLGRDLRHLVNVVKDLNDREIGLRVLTGQGAQIGTTTSAGRLGGVDGFDQDECGCECDKGSKVPGGFLAA